MQVRNPDAPISANEPIPLRNAPEQSPIADSSRLTDTCRKRASPAKRVISAVIQPSGRLATSEMPQPAAASAMRPATVSPAVGIPCTPTRSSFRHLPDLAQRRLLKTEIGKGVERDRLLDRAVLECQLRRRF